MTIDDLYKIGWEMETSQAAYWVWKPDDHWQAMWEASDKQSRAYVRNELLTEVLKIFDPEIIAKFLIKINKDLESLEILREFEIDKHGQPYYLREMLGLGDDHGESGNLGSA